MTTGRMMPTVTTSYPARVITWASDINKGGDQSENIEKTRQYKTDSSRIYSAEHSLFNRVESNISRHVKRLDVDLKCWYFIQD